MWLGGRAGRRPTGLQNECAWPRTPAALGPPHPSHPHAPSLPISQSPSSPTTSPTSKRASCIFWLGKEALEQIRESVGLGEGTVEKPSSRRAGTSQPTSTPSHASSLPPHPLQLGGGPGRGVVRRRLLRHPVHLLALLCGYYTCHWQVVCGKTRTSASQAGSGGAGIAVAAQLLPADLALHTLPSVRSAVGYGDLHAYSPVEAGFMVAIVFFNVRAARSLWAVPWGPPVRRWMHAVLTRSPHCRPCPSFWAALQMFWFACERWDRLRLQTPRAGWASAPAATAAAPGAPAAFAAEPLSAPASLASSQTSSVVSLC